MASSAHIQSLVDRNAAIKGYQVPPNFQQLGELFTANPDMPRTIIISCADPRCHPETIFGLDSSNPSDAAIVIRNQGGDFQTALPAILAIDSLVNFTHAILLKHTDCGSGVFRDAKIKALVKERASDNAAVVDAMRFGENTIPMDESVRRDLKLLRENQLVSEAIRTNVTGMLFHLDTGKVEIIE